MTRAALALLLLALPAHAGDTAPGPMAALVPGEWQRVVFETTCTALGDCCGIHRPCGDYYQRAPDPAPVPLPASLYILASAMVLVRIVKGNTTC